MSLKRFLSQSGAVASFCAVLTLSFSSPLLAGSGGSESDFSGPLGLKELIAIALKNNPDLVELRGEITIGEARKIAEKDWRDPELRFARSWENDKELDKPYEERIVERSTDRIGDSNRDQSGSKKESATRTVSEETVRKITPGADSDTIQETTTRRETTKGVEKGVDSKGVGERLNFNRTETLQRTTDREEFHGQDPLARDDDYSFRLRIYPPNPKEKKARLRRAQAEIDTTRAKLRSEERKVIAWVRNKYEEIQYLKAKIGISKQEEGTHEGFVKDLKVLEGQTVTAEEVAMAGVTTVLSSFEIDAAQNAYDNAVGELAAKLGIVQASRIQIYDSLARPSLPLESRDLAYFIELAFANRGELQEILSEGQISEAELDVAKSKYMPWFNYVQVDYGINNTGGQQTSDNYGIQFGMSLPFFSWLGHEKAIYEAAVEARYATMGAIKNKITGEVANAYRAVKSSADLKARSESQYQSAMGKLKAAEALQMVDKDGAKLRYDAAKMKVKVSEARLGAQREYNKALLLFEEAIGSDISEIYSSTVSADPYSDESETVVKKNSASAEVDSKDDKAAAMELAARIERNAKKAAASAPVEKEEAPVAEPEVEAKEKKTGVLSKIFKRREK
jgi:outer membrane protein TolC